MKGLRSAVVAILLPCVAAAGQGARSLPREIAATGDRMAATGRWVRTRRVNSTAPLIARLNSVDIVCVKARGVCHEAVALLYTREDAPQMSGQFLTSLLTEYEIKRWDDSEISAVAAKSVADVEIRIDLKAGTATRRHRETKARGSRTANPDLIVEWELR